MFMQSMLCIKEFPLKKRVGIIRFYYTADKRTWWWWNIN